MQKISSGQRALRKGRVSLPHQMYHVTTATVDRREFFRDFSVATAVANCCENKLLLGDAQMLAWVLMPDHVHWLLQLGAKDDLSSVVNRLKSASSRRANKILGQKGAIWQKSFHDHALRAEEDVRAIARYIVANPLRAGLVDNVHNYPFWDAIWL
jgi:REP element-mobilizing transposase RayT